MNGTPDSVTAAGPLLGNFVGVVLFVPIFSNAFIWCCCALEVEL